LNWIIDGSTPPKKCDLPPTGDRLAQVRAKIANAKVVCFTVPEIAGNRDN